MTTIQTYRTYAHDYEIDVDPSASDLNSYILIQLGTGRRYQYKTWYGSIPDLIRMIERRAYLIERLDYTGIDEAELSERILMEGAQLPEKDEHRGTVYYSTPHRYRQSPHVMVDSDNVTFYHFGEIEKYPLRMNGKRFIGTDEDWVIAITDWNLDPVVRHIDFEWLWTDICFINKRTIYVYDASGNPI